MQHAHSFPRHHRKGTCTVCWLVAAKCCGPAHSICQHTAGHAWHTVARRFMRRSTPCCKRAAMPRAAPRPGPGHAGPPPGAMRRLSRGRAQVAGQGYEVAKHAGSGHSGPSARPPDDQRRVAAGRKRRGARAAERVRAAGGPARREAHTAGHRQSGWAAAAAAPQRSSQPRHPAAPPCGAKNKTRACSAAW